MSASGDDVNWTEQLKQLPVGIRSAIVAFRVVGMVALVVGLVVVNTGRELGWFEDKAATDRRQIMASIQDIATAVKAQSKAFEKIEVAITAQKEVAEKDASNTRIIAQSLCFQNRDMTEKERRECVGGVR